MHVIKFLFSIGLFLVSITWIYIRQLFIPSWFAYEALWPTESEVDFEAFKRDWCLVRRQRFDWQGILRPCLDPDSHEMSTSSLASDASLSFVRRFDLHPAGEHSRVIIQSVTRDGIRKWFGGDAWRVMYRSRNETISASVVDLGNGEYEATVLLLTSGVHSINIILDYTQCKGLKDPPMEWFLKVHCSGQTGQRIIGQDVLSDMSDCVSTKLKGSPYHVIISSPRYPIKLLDRVVYGVDCGSPCSLLWDGHGSWSNDAGTAQRWKSHKTQEWRRPKVTRQKLFFLGNKHSVLWIYGDSISYYFYNLQRNRSLCSSVFWFCQNTYNWIYPKKLYELKQTCSDVALDVERVKDVLKNVTSQKEMGPTSVLLFNAGAHYVKNTSFKNYQAIVDGLIEIVKQFYRGLAVWKSTTAIHEQRATIMGALRRYMTNHRTLLFNAYANSAMCDAGVPLLDVYPMTSSYPLGTIDGVHYKSEISEEVGRLLSDYFDTS